MRKPAQLIARHVTKQREANEQPTSCLLSDLRDQYAYVLLGEPGSGKSTAFDMEARAMGTEPISAHDFIDGLMPSGAADQPIFIDALDETGTSHADGGTALSKVRKRLMDLSRPLFRLSCREADWLAEVNAVDIAKVVPSGQLTIWHLAPFTDEEIQARLHQLLDEKTAAAFWQGALERGLSDILRNPKLLDLTVDVYQSNKATWPKSKQEAYELTSRNLAKEHNTRRAASSTAARVPVDTLLHDAGMLCAVLLLAGRQGYSLMPTSPREGYVALVDLPGALAITEPDIALRSKLFEGPDNARKPTHRTTAEFLAARSLAKLVADGLPITRLQALMTSSVGDDGVVTQLRGLHAWLAAFCPTARTHLIDTDPLGVVLYGDSRNFSAMQKQHALHALSQQAQRYPWFRSQDWAHSPFGALGTRDMIDTFREWLSKPDRDTAHQSTLLCVLDAIEHGDPMPELIPILEQVVRDASHQREVRTSALQAWMSQSNPNFGLLRQLLDDIQDQTVEDPDHSLAGKLLRELYPVHVSPGEVVRYLQPPQRGNSVGSYGLFWRFGLPEETPGGGIEELTNSWVEKGQDAIDAWPLNGLMDTTSKLIVQALHACGDRITSEQLYKWLSFGWSRRTLSMRINQEASQQISDWLSARPETQKALWATAMSHIDPASTQRIDFLICDQVFYRASPPADMALWLLETAAKTTNERVAEFCFQRVAAVSESGVIQSGLSAGHIESWVIANTAHWPHAARWLEAIWSRSPVNPLGEYAEQLREGQSEHQARQQEWIAEFRQHIADVRRGASDNGMNNLARAYQGNLIEANGETPDARLNNFFADDQELVSAALQGFEACLRRDDLPSIDDILQTDLEQRYHLIRPACRVGADLQAARNADLPLQWNEALAKRLVAFWLTDGTEKTPAWFLTLARERAPLVADVMARYVKGRLHRKLAHITSLYDLATEDAMAEVAQLIVPPLLESFPVRASEEQLTVLQELLHVASLRLPSPDLLPLIDRKLALKSLSGNQRVTWLATGLRLQPSVYAQPLATHVKANQKYARQLGQLLSHRGLRIQQAADTPPEALAQLIEALAPHAAAERPIDGEAHWVTPADEVRDVVRAMFNQLAAHPCIEATAQLQRLAQIPALKSWHDYTQHALFNQSTVARQASFSHANMAAVADVLAQLAPANAADLAALVVEHLRLLGRELRGADTTPLTTLWRDPDPETGKRQPRIENECRDRILDRLRDRLRSLDIDIAPESRAGFEKRADMRAVFTRDGRRFAVPIEVKLEHDEKLWTAAEQQLQARYTTDPNADGRGIYLVLWFGLGAKRHPVGKPVRSAAELETLLRDNLPPALRTHIAVCVLDCSWPEPTQR